MWIDPCILQHTQVEKLLSFDQILQREFPVVWGKQVDKLKTSPFTLQQFTQLPRQCYTIDTFMTLFHCYYQWKITMVTQQCDEATGREVWQRGSVKHRCVTSVYAHTEPRCLAITRESSRVIRTDPLRDVKTGHSPLRHAQSAPIIVAPFGCEMQRADESLWDSKWRKGFSLPRWSRGMRGTSSPTGSSENGFIFTLFEQAQCVVRGFYSRVSLKCRRVSILPA